MPYEGRRVLVIQNLNGSNKQYVPPWDDMIELVGFIWKSDNVIVFKIHMTLDRQVFRSKTSETRLISYDMDKQAVHWLGEPKKTAFSRGDTQNVSQLERIVDRLPQDPDHVLVQLDFELDGYPAVYKINVATGKRKKIHSQRTGINEWFSDSEGKIRFGSGYKVNKSTRNYLYKQAGGKWVSLEGKLLTNEYRFEGIGPEPGQLYVTATNEHGTLSILLVNIFTDEVISTLFSDPDVDMSSIITHSNTGQVVGVSYTDDFNRQAYFDRDIGPLHRGLKKALPDSVVTITNSALVAKKYLILASNDRDPGTYYLYDRETKQLEYFDEARADIDPELSAPTRRVNITVSDGASIPAYLTLPITASEQLLPTIVLPHGGPTARDSAHWGYETQFYASRGYAVLKPNFRGSSGYGDGFEGQGVKQWGGKMQQDVTDATRWLISEGIADPDRICIVGSSYGGYSALMGLIQQPGLYACGVSVNGVINLPALKNVDRNFLGGRNWIKRMGLEGANDRDVSPQHQAKSIQDPVLLIATTNDARISYKQTKKLHKLLKKLKRDSTYVELDTGTHYMLNSESRLASLTAIEGFLSEQLAP